MEGAKFISKYLNFSHGIRDEEAEVLQRGKRVIVKGLEAQFGPGALTEEDIRVALDTLSFHGLPEDRDTGADISGRYRLGLFDSALAAKNNKWTDEEHQEVLDGLRASPQFGIDFIEVVPQPAAVPWPSYVDLDDVDTIVAVIEATGIPVDKVLAFEKENQNRSNVIAALEEILPEDDDEAVFIDASGS